eukprot:TRINITY_DN10127_c0_g2_i1.p1 TRINITY_DN10127_c0_g2~~TRINITY_DN10127_c0_g2_i1.p1  ORF type:complete len:778 (+),score=341.25 TRINITY_DN10127_c0_g2_i1:60-2393(+)
MRLNFTQCSSNQHKEACCAVVWSSGNELYSCGDDCTVWRWNMAGEPLGKVCDLESNPTDMVWYPHQGKRGDQGKDLFVVACADGFYRVISATTGRVEKAIEAHKGALTCLAWNGEGGALATGGEDGTVKIWSATGMLRSTLAQQAQCIHALAWSPENDQVLLASGKELTIKPLQPSNKHLSWVAHASPVLSVDWSPVSNLIVSGAEDGKFKVWDPYGRQTYCCTVPADYSITSVAFSPDGQCIAIGSYNSLRICDKTGWTHCRDSCKTGSIFSIAWSSDSTQLAGAGGTGAVCLAQMVDRKLTYGKYEVSLRESNRVRVYDFVAETAEELDHRDKVINMSVGYGYLVIATTTQCVIYATDNFNTPHQFDLKATVNLILQAEKLFAIVDLVNGIQLHNYDGRAQCVVKTPQLTVSMINNYSLALSNDTFAVRDAGNSRAVQIFDCQNGRPRTEFKIEHTMEISEIALSQYGDLKSRKLAIVDRNRDLYLVSLAKGGKTAQSHKLAAMVSSMKWNDQSEVLIALADLKLVIWYYPSVVFIDKDLLPKTRSIREDGQVQIEFGWNDQIIDFFSTRTSIRRGTDGAVLTFTVSPYPSLIFNNITNNNWEAATRLCRVVKEPFMWSVLAGLAVQRGELKTAEIAYAALEEIDKLQYMRYIQEIPVPERRAAELALFQRRIDEAEQILLQAGLHFRAIMMNIDLFNWEQALELATTHMTHVDTVLAYRQAHLTSFGKKEHLQSFLSRTTGENAVTLSWDKIKAKIDEEEMKERNRGDAKLYKG